MMVIDKNRGIREFYGLELADERYYNAVMVGDAAAVEEAIRHSKPDLVILDPWIGGEYRWPAVGH
jgi:DNA-binding NtrC family response regulator